MKLVKLVKNERFSVVALVAQIFEAPMPNRFFSYKQAAEISDLMTKFRDAEKAAAEHVILENSEHSLLSKTVEEFQFPFMNPELADVLMAIVKAEDYKLQEIPKSEAKGA